MITKKEILEAIEKVELDLGRLSYPTQKENNLIDFKKMVIEKCPDEIDLGTLILSAVNLGK